MTVLNHQGEVIEVDAAESFLSLEAFGAERGSQVYIEAGEDIETCLLYTSPSPRDKRQSRMPSSA